MKKKKVLAMSMASVLVMSSLIGCGAGEKTSETTAAATKAAEAATTKAVAEGASTVVEENKGPITTEPITISIFTTMSDAEADVEKQWFYQYLEYYMREKGYDLTIEISSSDSADQQVSLMLGTDTLADLYIGPALTMDQAVMYGAEDKILLDWAPYLNEETMPNFCAMMEKEPTALVASTYSDGGVYGLPYVSDRNRAEGAGDYTGNHAFYVNKNWLEQCNLAVPETFDEFMNMLRTFKSDIKTENGEEVVPIISVTGANRLERYLWSGLGYYAENKAEKNGTQFAIKDGEVYLPAYTDDYDTYIEIMKTLYDEGLISKDFYTEDAVTSRGLIAAGVAGVHGDWNMTTTVPDTFKDWVALKPIAIGDTEPHSHCATNYRLGSLWASASTEYPEVLAEMVDYMYSLEGIVHYFYGPMKGQDPLGMLDGWYIGEDGRVTTASVEDGTFGSMENYAQRNVYPWLYGVPRVEMTQTAYKMAGLEDNSKSYEIVDAVTGEEITIYDTGAYSNEDANGYGRFTVMDEWEGRVTAVRLPSVFLTEELSLRAKEIETVIMDHINSESAKFVTGVRPISELPAYKEELKAMGIEEYIQIYKDAYSGYMKSVFK